MEETQNNLAKFSLTYGAILGIALVVYGLLLYITGLTFNKALGLLQYVILIGGIYISVKTFRDKVEGGFISYGKALGFSVLVVFYASIISVFFNFILIKYIDPSLVEKSLAVVAETLENSRFIPEDQIDAALERSRRSMTALWSLPVGVLTFTFIGFIISLITSAIVKKDPNPVA